MQNKTPSRSQIFSKQSCQLSDQDVLGLIGRKQEEVDLELLNKYYKGKTILINGGAGSIGSEAVRTLLDLEVEKVVVLDWWENGMFYLEQEIKDKRLVCRIGDVKTKRLQQVIKEQKPQIVIHASAYKHLPLMQINAMEAFNNNVYGTYNAIQACQGVEKFIMISTDKAVNTTNVMGATKRICEILIENQKGNYCAVRFGNVIQSNGSVIPTWLKQIERGEDVTVTHKKITRYFMTKREAVELVLLAGIYSRGQEIFLLDMGKPVRIYDLAEKLIEHFNSKSKIVVTGLRRGEKMAEELSFDPKTMLMTDIPKLFLIQNKDHYSSKYRHILKSFEKTLSYQFNDSQIVAMLRNLGFMIKA